MALDCSDFDGGERVCEPGADTTAGPSRIAGHYSGRNSEITTRTTTAIKVRVNLVLLRVVVRDRDGKVIPNLKVEDFQVLDNGKPQKISTFSVETAPTAPTGETVASERKAAERETGAGVVIPPVMPQRFVALVFDDLHMRAADSMAVRAATKKLFTSLKATDRVAIYSTSGTLQQDFTGDAEVLRKTLAAIVPHASKDEGQYGCPDISYYQADLIVNKHDQEAITTAAMDAQLNNCPANISADAKRILEAGDEQTRESHQYLEIS